MIKFRTSKEISQIFDINLAKWKRWSREFLPPDPLGGLQSGYARQYHLDEVFTVYLGGHLVADLKFTIPEAKQTLDDLHQWLVDHDFYFDFSGAASPAKDQSIQPVQDYQITIISTNNSAGSLSGLNYRLKAIVSSDLVEFNGVPMQQQRFIETWLKKPANEAAALDIASYRVLNISVLRQIFLGHFDSD